MESACLKLRNQIGAGQFCLTLCYNPLYTTPQNTGIRLLGNQLPQSSIQYFGAGSGATCHRNPVRLVLLDFSAWFVFAKLRYNLAKQHPYAGSPHGTP